MAEYLDKKIPLEWGTMPLRRLIITLYHSINKRLDKANVAASDLDISDLDINKLEKPVPQSPDDINP